MLGNPFLGKLSDRTSGPWGMRRPWMVIGLLGGSLGVLVVAVARTVPVVLAGWCVAQPFFNALLAALVAVLPDQVPATQRGQVSGVLGICLPVASVCGTFLVQLFAGNQLAMCSPRRSSTAWRCSWWPWPATSTASWSAWRSAASGSASTWPSTSRSSPTSCRARTTPRTSASSTSPVRCCSPSRPPS